MLKMSIHKEAVEHPIPCVDCNGPADYLFFQRVQARGSALHLQKKHAKCAGCIESAEQS